MRAAVVVAMVMCAVGCASEPERVFVQGPGFRHVVAVTTAQGDHAEVAVGEWLVLHASRESGPWLEKRRADAPPDGCWTGAIEAAEPEVAANVRWEVEPGGIATFDLPQADTMEKRTRQVRFSQPGEYRLVATSALPCSRQRSNTIVVVVRPK